MASAGKRGPIGLAHWLALASLIVLADQFTKVLVIGYYGLGEGQVCNRFFQPGAGAQQRRGFLFSG